MKNFMIRFSLTLTAMTLIAIAGLSIAAEPLRLTVSMSGLENNDGKVVVKLCNSQEGYERRDGAPFKLAKVPIANKTSVAEFTGLAAEEYTLKIYHDENSNGEHDQNFMGIPKEDYAFSNNAGGMFGQPDYEEAVFTLSQDMTMEIHF